MTGNSNSKTVIYRDGQSDRPRERERQTDRQTDRERDNQRQTVRDREDVPKALAPSCTWRGSTRRQCQFLGSLSVGGVYEGSAELETG